MTLPVSNVVNVSISLAALAAGPRSFGSLLILGSTSGVIDTIERMREFSSIEEVGKNYGVDDPEYKAALAYFGQSPKPRTLYIGYWHKDGQTPETIQEAVTACLDSLKWYGLVIASDLTDEQVLSVAALIEASDPVRLLVIQLRLKMQLNQPVQLILLISSQMQNTAVHYAYSQAITLMQPHQYLVVHLA